MKPKWLISSNCYDDGNPEKMRDAAIRQGCVVNWFKYIPFEQDDRQKFLFGINGEPASISEMSVIDHSGKGIYGLEDCVISYGSIQLSRLVERATKWTPGSWTGWDKLACSYYLTHLAQFSIHEDFVFITLGEFIRRPEYYFKLIGTTEDSKLFIKPDSNAKEFHGEVVSLSEYDRWKKFAFCYEPAKELMCLISKPSKIIREWRCVIADRKFVTGSQYRILVKGELSAEPDKDCPKDVQQFVEIIAESTEFQPSAIYCMDIGETIDGRLKLIEIGGVNCAGLYCCDIDKIVEKANEIAVREWQELYVT